MAGKKKHHGGIMGHIEGHKKNKAAGKKHRKASRRTKRG